MGNTQDRLSSGLVTELDAMFVEEFLASCPDGTPTKETLVACLERLRDPIRNLLRSSGAVEQGTVNILRRLPENDAMLHIVGVRPGFYTSIHDHGDSVGAVFMERGNLTEHVFTPKHSESEAITGGVAVTRSQQVCKEGSVAPVERYRPHLVVNQCNAIACAVQLYVPWMNHYRKFGYNGEQVIHQDDVAVRG